MPKGSQPGSDAGNRKAARPEKVKAKKAQAGEAVAKTTTAVKSGARKVKATKDAAKEKASTAFVNAFDSVINSIASFEKDDKDK
jgi:hypothetical protein